MTTDNKTRTREDFARLVERGFPCSPEPGWTDTPEYIRDTANFAFRICGRWFAFNDCGKLIDLD